ncbi:MAG: hypothetical protein AABY22_09975 [Nanoarchaeota archaeon]
MTIEEVVKKSTIKFPKNMSLNQAESLIVYIAKKLPAIVNYTISQQITDGYYTDSKEFFRSKGTAKIRGARNQSTKPFTFDSFTFKHSVRNNSTFSLMQFELTPDWELSEYRPEVRKLWDDIRKIINEYFHSRH